MADASDPTALVVAIAKAEKAETDEEKKKYIADLRFSRIWMHFVIPVKY